MIEVEIHTFGGVASLLAYFAEQSAADDLYFPEANDDDLSFAAALARVAAAAVVRIAARQMLAEYRRGV